ncbi:MAG: response regulator transcription factor [Chloroflexota bacterium]|nr:response regulator transcription factor [Chloroflexota bacterium]
MDCLVVCGIPAARLGLEIGLREAGHSVRSVDRWPGHVGAERVIVTDLGGADDFMGHLRQLRSDSPGCLIIVWAEALPGHAEATHLYERWVVPTQPINQLCNAITAAAGRVPARYIDGSRQTVEVEPVHGGEGLTRTELLVIRQFHPSVTLSEKELSLRLNVSVNTVRTHLRRIESKTGVGSLRELQRHTEAALVKLAGMTDKPTRNGASGRKPPLAIGERR